MEFALHGLAEYSLISKHNLTAGLQFKDLLSSMLSMPRPGEEDEDDELDDLPLFQPSRSTGLTDDMVQAAADYLNGKTDKDMRCNKVVRVFQNLSALVVGHKG